MTYNPSYTTVLPASPVATLGLGADPGISFGLRTTWGILSLLSAIASGYHGYRRYSGNIGWTALWGLGGAVFPIIVPIVALIQGFAEPRRGKGFGRRRRARRSPKRYGRYTKRYRRRKA
jgi:hypothetical protein